MDLPRLETVEICLAAPRDEEIATDEGHRLIKCFSSGRSPPLVFSLHDVHVNCIHTTAYNTINKSSDHIEYHERQADSICFFLLHHDSSLSTIGLAIDL